MADEKLPDVVRKRLREKKDARIQAWLARLGDKVTGNHEVPGWVIVSARLDAIEEFLEEAFAGEIQGLVADRVSQELFDLGLHSGEGLP